MGKLIACKSCGKEIAKSAKSCPQCGAKRKGGFGQVLLWATVFVMGIFVLAAVVGETDGETTASTSGDEQTTFAIGETLSTPKMDVTIRSVSTRGAVGSEYLREAAAQGGILVVVEYSVKNTSDKPLASFALPSVYLQDYNDVRYKMDIGKSSIYASEVDSNMKSFSDLNPGIEVKDYVVFEVAEEYFEKSGWTLRVEADQKFLVRVN